MIFFCTHVSDFLAYGYRSEGCASWASPLTPFIFLIFSLSAQFVRRFAPISSIQGSGLTTLTLVIFWNFKKKSLLVLNDRSKYPPRHCLLMRPALFYFLIEFFLIKKLFFAVFDDFFVRMCQIFCHMGTGQRAVPLEPALWHPLFFWSSVYVLNVSVILRLFPVIWGLDLQS